MAVPRLHRRCRNTRPVGRQHAVCVPSGIILALSAFGGQKIEASPYRPACCVIPLGPPPSGYPLVCFLPGCAFPALERLSYLPASISARRRFSRPAKIHCWTHSVPVRAGLRSFPAPPRQDFHLLHRRPERSPIFDVENPVEAGNYAANRRDYPLQPWSHRASPSPGTRRYPTCPFTRLASRIPGPATPSPFERERLKPAMQRFGKADGRSGWLPDRRRVHAPGGRPGRQAESFPLIP